MIRNFGWFKKIILINIFVGLLKFDNCKSKKDNYQNN